MYKRALMLTAATIALLSGPASAATTGCDSSNTTDFTDNTKQVTVPLCTKFANAGSAGNIKFESNGSLSVNGSVSSNGTIPALEINSNNIVTFEQGSKFTFTGVNGSIGIKMDQGFTGELLNLGSWDISGNGTTKTGIEIGSPNIATPGTFTGISDTTNNTLDTASSALTAIALDAGSTIKVQGDGSFGIHLLTGDTLDGDIYVGGTLLAESSNLNATTSGGSVVGIQLNGNTTGNLLVNTSGVISSIGAGSQGVIVLGNLDGYIENLGSITTTGSTTPTTNNSAPVSGTALAISNSVTGGIFNGGPTGVNDASATATIGATSSAPTVVIAPGFDAITAAPIVIGEFTHDPGGLTYSFLNRGAIASAPPNENLASAAIQIAGESAVNTVTLSDGFFNSGSITSRASNNSNLSGTSQAVGISIGDFVDINQLAGNPAAFVNSNVSGHGSIAASVSGAESSSAIAIDIAANASVPSLYNDGTISASAVSSDATVSSLRAFAVFDQSGTLTTIQNNGTISAVAHAVVNGTVSNLNNNANQAFAISLGAATTDINLTNAGSIFGDIVLGSGNDTVTVSGSNTLNATISGNINFGGGSDTLTVGPKAIVTGNLLETLGGEINVSVATGGTLTDTNNGSTSGGLPLPSTIAPNLQVSNLMVATGGTLGLTLSDAFNVNTSSKLTPVVQANLTSGTITLDQGAILKMNFGGFVSAGSLASGNSAEFIVFDAANGSLKVSAADIKNDLENGIPWLFQGTACGYNVTGGFAPCSTPNPEGSTHSDIILNLSAKDPATSTASGGLGLHGYALKMFSAANTALANDSVLGAAVINAGALPSGQAKFDNAFESQLYNKIYAAFAPDVTGSARAIAISITDQASGIVGARQRALRMYAGQDGEMTLWGQEFGQRLSVPNTLDAAGYNNTGFGIALGADGGDIRDGRYGAALTFYAGDTREKSPRLSKTTSEWYMLTGYQDWRGRGLFFDSQASIGVGTLDGKRTFPIPDSSGITRIADGKRASELAAGGFTTGVILNTGGTVFIPQLSIDGLTMREEKYTESGGGAGMDLHVESSYASSLRAFLGADLRQDLKFGSYFLQPEVRAGYRYDFLNGAAKLKVNFAGDPNISPVVNPGQQFTIAGPDPAKGNLLAGGGIAITTDAWSIGVNYDYLRGLGGAKGTDQTAMVTLIGRI